MSLLEKDFNQKFKKRLKRSNGWRFGNNNLKQIDANTLSKNDENASGSRLSRKNVDIESDAFIYDEDLLKRSFIQWCGGDWESLSTLDCESLHHHRHRAELTLLAASANFQKNNHKAGRQLLQLSQEWGCSKDMICQVLVSGVHINLGRAAKITGQSLHATRHFEHAIRIDIPVGQDELMALENVDWSEIYPNIGDKPYGMSHEAGNTGGNDEKENASKIKHQKQQNLKCCKEAYHYYKRHSHDHLGCSFPLYIQFDAKSIPRSGIHYLKNAFSRVLGEHFSFCERYQEPGCCNKMPCAITGYSEMARKMNAAKLRITKSHDFELNDPDFMPLYNLRRIVLIREPLPILTSWFSLDQLAKHKNKLQKKSINMEKIWAYHEPEVLAMAYETLDSEFEAPEYEILKSWLSEKTHYIIGFLEKWVGSDFYDSPSYFQLIRYEEINSFIITTLNEIYDYLSDDSKKRVRDFNSKGPRQFRPRNDPFLAPSEKLSSFISENAEIFIQYAKKVKASAPGGVFESDSLV